MSFDGAVPGTPEREWRAAGVREAAAALDVGAVRRLVVLAAHPDDETLMAGGLIHAIAAADKPVALVVATLGEASHPASQTTNPAALAAWRERELVAAAAELAPQAEVTLLRLPDGGLSAAGDRLDAALSGIVRPGDTVVAPWRLDGHPDHEALGAAAARAAAVVGAVLLEAPIWAWHWGRTTDAWPTAVRFDLGGSDVAAKSTALSAHRSQIEPLSALPGDEVLLIPQFLEYFAGADELFFPSGAVPVDFDAMYAQSDDPWGFASRWYEQRKRALTAAALPLPRYGRALEIGCSTGLLAEALLERVDSLLAVDGAARAVELASARFAGDPRVRIERRRLPDEWPDERFDLVVLSETGFYLSRAQLIVLADRIAAALEPGGHVLLCHWRPYVAGLELAGDQVHEILRARLGAATIVRHVEDDFVLEVLGMADGWSVARATGLR